MISTTIESLSDKQARLTLNAIKLGELPADKIAEIKEYALRLRRKFPHMKPARIQRKVAEYYKIKLI